MVAGERAFPTLVGNALRQQVGGRQARSHLADPKGTGEAEPVRRRPSVTKANLPPVSGSSWKNERQVYGDRADMLRAARAMRNRQARMALRIAFHSGMRLSEIKRAQPRGEVWVLDDTKNGQPRHVPIHSRAAVCARHFNRAMPKITIQRCWERARDAAGLQGMHFHDWRHTAASELINAGVDLYTVGRVLGHKDARSTQRYAHLAVGTLAAAVGRIGGKNPIQPKK